MGLRNAFFRRITAALPALAALVVASCIATSCGSSRHAASSASRSSRAISASSGKAKPTTTIKVDNSLPQETRALLAEASKWLGTSYRYGGDTRSGVDCSGLVLNLYRSALAIKLPRSSAQQQEYCSRISKKDLMEGDLVFFVTGKGGKVNHVGMYIGDGRMIHSSASRGVIVSGLDEDYYARNFHSAGRVDSYYAMVRGKKGKKKGQTAEPVIPATIPPADDDVMIAQSNPPTQGNPPAQTSAKVTDRIIEEVVKPAATTTVKVVASEAATRIAGKTGITVASVTPPPATRKAIEITRRQILDETLNQKVDSIVSEYFD